MIYLRDALSWFINSDMPIIALLLIPLIWIIKKYLDRVADNATTGQLFKSVLAVFLFCAFSILAIVMFGNPNGTVGIWLACKFTKSNEKPIIIAIHPNDSFGVDQSRGLRRALQSDLDRIKIVELSAPYEDMKNNDVQGLVARLKNHVCKDNVVAVIGPSVTECTDSILSAIEDHNKNIPVFLGTAAPRELIGFGSRKLPLFRISSGVDERALEFASIAQSLAESNTPMLFLFESNRESEGKTYGEYLFQAIQNHIPNWKHLAGSNLVRSKEFRPKRISEEYERLNLKVELMKEQVVLLLGTGSDFRAVVESFYSIENTDEIKAKLGSWMNGWVFRQLAKSEKNYRWNLLFEITDVDWSRPIANIDIEKKTEFMYEFKELTPENRDAALFFDSASLAIQAYDQALEQSRRSDGTLPPIDDQAREKMTYWLKNTEINGVFGKIRFNDDGQNSSVTELTYCTLDVDSKRWIRIKNPQAFLSNQQP